MRNFLLTLILCVVACEDKKKDDGCINESQISGDPCITIFDPVCGCDDKTYSNSCVAFNSGVTEWTNGECQ